MKKLFGIISVAGLILAVCVADGSAYELPARIAGVIMFGLGAYLGGFMDINKEKGQKQ